EDHHHAAGHVLAAVIADALDHRRGAAVAHRESLSGQPGGVELAAGGAVEHGVSDDDVLLRREACSGRGTHDDPAAGEALADVVVGVALELERDSRRQERAEALACRALEAYADAVVRKARGAADAGDLPGEHRSDGAMSVLDREHDEARRSALE